MRLHRARRPGHGRDAALLLSSAAPADPATHAIQTRSAAATRAAAAWVMLSAPIPDASMSLAGVLEAGRLQTAR